MACICSTRPAAPCAKSFSDFPTNSMPLNLFGGIFSRLSRDGGGKVERGRTISHWTLQGPDGAALQTGTSFSLLAEDGRFQAISGFFHAPGGGEAN